MRRRRHDEFAEEGGDTGADSEGHITGAVNRQKAMNALEMEEWRNVRRKNKWKLAPPNEKRTMKDGEVEKYRCRLTA